MKALLVAALATGTLASSAAAAVFTVTHVDRSRPGWVRIALSYAAKGAPTFRLTPICRMALGAGERVASIVHLVPARRRAAIHVREDLGWHADRHAACGLDGIVVEMLEHQDVVASTEILLVLPAPPAVPAPAAAPPARAPSRFGVAGRKHAVRQTRMSEASVTMAVTDRLTVHVSYERTAFAPTMSRDHDDGILTGLKIGF